jgi:hypothetical protein
VSSLIFAPTVFHPGREPEVPIVWEGVWTLVPVWALVRSEKCLASAGSHTLDHQADSLVTVPTEL